MKNKLLRFATDPGYRFLHYANRGKYNNLPDDVYLTRKFKAIMGYDLDLDSPKTFNEKIQWLKIHDQNPRYTKMVDKYDAKEYVGSVIGEEHIVETYGVWDRFDDIDFGSLPSSFVLKCTHDSGGLVICKDKDVLDINSAKEKIERCLKRNYYFYTREWPYKDVKPRIIAEKYIEMENGGGLIDYKFFCFNYEPKLLYISRGLDHHPTAQISFYGMDGTEMPYHRKDYKPYHNALLPSNFSEMKEISHKLAQDIGCPFVRIDLYSICNRVYFSEITFSPCSGMVPFEPAAADRDIGDLLILPFERENC